jgi:hypothetical protein
MRSALTARAAPPRITGVSAGRGGLDEAQRREATPLDGLAAHVLRGAVEEILPAMVAV